MLPQDIVNQAIDFLPGAALIGAFSDGTRESEWARRWYGPSLRALLRASHWAFARKMARLQLLADSTGQTLAPGTGQPISRAVEMPWRFCYAWPTDGVQPRFLPWSLAPPSGTAPIMANLNAAGPACLPLCPAPFLVSSSDQFPAETGRVDWANRPDLDGVEGVGALSRRVVLSDVPGAQLVYTRLVLNPLEWDALFHQAFVAVLAALGAVPLIPDPKLKLAIRAQQIALAKEQLGAARAASANEAGFPQTTDHVPDWLRARSSGGSWAGDPGPGYLRCGWEAMSFADGSSI